MNAAKDHVKQIMFNMKKMNITFSLICGSQNSLEIN